jgi:hypothetical protein
MSQEFLPAILEVMEHLLEQAAGPDRRVEDDEAGAARVGNRLEVLVGSVGFVGGHFVDREAFRRSLDSRPVPE